jgi:nucleoside-diphosphate-sugar epimerase
MKKVFITGGTGFIGTHLVKRLLDDGHSVRMLVRKASAETLREYADRGIEPVFGDVGNTDAIRKAMKDVDVVFHLAGIVSDWGRQDVFNAVNVDGTRNMCDAALERNVKLFIYFSTNDVFGYGEDKVITETDDFKYWNEPYPDSKIDATRIVRDSEKKGLPVSIIYPCWVYGPGDTTFITPMAEALKSRMFMFWRKNALVWPLYIDNLIDLLMVMMTNPSAVGKGFIAHDGLSVTFEDFTDTLCRYLGLRTTRRYIPYTLAYGAGVLFEALWKTLGKTCRPLLTTYSVKNLGSRWRFSIDNARQTLNWKPSHTYEEGMDTTMKWYMTHR